MRKHRQKDLPPTERDWLERPKGARIHGSTIAFILGIVLLTVIIALAVLTGPLINLVLPPMTSSENSTSSSYGVMNDLYSIPLFGGTLQSMIGSTGAFPDASQDLKVVESTFHHDRSYAWVEGTIKNTGNRSYQGCMIFYDLYDQQGKRVGFSYALMANINPGDVQTFQTLSTNVSASSARLKTILGG